MISLTKQTSKGQAVVTLVNGQSIVTVAGVEMCRSTTATTYSPLPAGYTHILGKLVLTASEAAQHNAAFAAHLESLQATLEAAPKTLTEQREALVITLSNAQTDAFPGSAAWLRQQAAEKALAAFDAAHPEIAEFKALA